MGGFTYSVPFLVVIGNINPSEFGCGNTAAELFAAEVSNKLVELVIVAQVDGNVGITVERVCRSSGVKSCPNRVGITGCGGSDLTVGHRNAVFVGVRGVYAGCCVGFSKCDVINLHRRTAVYLDFVNKSHHSGNSGIEFHIFNIFINYSDSFSYFLIAYVFRRSV